MFKEGVCLCSLEQEEQAARARARREVAGDERAGAAIYFPHVFLPASSLSSASATAASPTGMSRVSAVKIHVHTAPRAPSPAQMASTTCRPLFLPAASVP